MGVVRGDHGGDFPERAGAEAGTGGGGSGERVCVHVAGAAASVAGVVREISLSSVNSLRNPEISTILSRNRFQDDQSFHLVCPLRDPGRVVLVGGGSFACELWQDFTFRREFERFLGGNGGRFQLYE